MNTPPALQGFDKHFYFLAGGECEMAFVLKEKYFSGSFDRAGSKTKNTKWFSNQTPTFMPTTPSLAL
jgi:hypothetical protein